MNRVWGLAGIVVLVLVLAGCGSAGSVTRTAEARVDYVVGEVWVDGRSVEVGDVIAPVFRVNTGVASEAGIVFDGKNILVVQEQTEAYIDLTADVKTVELRRGALGSTLRRLAQISRAEADRFRVKTPTAVAGVRGTTFFAKVEDPSRTYLCTCNGTLHLSDATGGDPRVSRATHHQAFRFIRGEDGVRAHPAEMAYHDDRSMEDGASRIGVSIDWTRLEGR